MSSRDKILSAVVINQPGYVQLPNISNLKKTDNELVENFIAVSTAIGSKVFRVNNIEEIKQILPDHFNLADRIVSNIDELSSVAEIKSALFEDPHIFNNVELSILKAHFGVAENGALWVTESNIGQRILPFICQHLALIVNEENLVSTMHDAYERIGKDDYGYGTFIAGPSKTADIAQSLVLGAHGPRSMTIFLLNCHT